MRPSIPTLFLALALGLTGCDTSTEELTAPPEPVRTSSLDVAADVVTQSPESGQAGIVRWDETIVLFFHHDARRNLLSVHLPPDFAGCGGSEPPNVGDRLIVTTPSEIQQTLVQIKDADSRVGIYRASSRDELFADFCGFLTGPRKIAEGTVRHVQTFSNASFAAHWGGTIEAVGGGRVHLSEVYQLRADAHDPANPAFWVLDASHILLSPVP